MIDVEQFHRFSENLYSTGQMEGKYKNGSIWGQSLVLKTERGISVCTGCAHPGVVGIAGEVRKQFPEEKGNAVFGGFHLKDDTPEAVDRTIGQLFDLGFEHVYPGHCSGGYAKGKGTGRLYVGAMIEV